MSPASQPIDSTLAQTRARSRSYKWNSSAVIAAHLAVLEVHDLVRVADEERTGRKRQVLAVADPEDQGAAQPGADDQVRVPRADDRQARTCPSKAGAPYGRPPQDRR